MYGYQPYQPFGGSQARQELIRVTGLEGARAYQMPPNSAAPLFDANSDLMYVKTTDGAGFPTIRTFAFSPVEEVQPAGQGYVTRAVFEQLKEMILNAKQPISAAAPEQQ